MSLNTFLNGTWAKFGLSPEATPGEISASNAFITTSKAINVTPQDQQEEDPSNDGSGQTIDALTTHRAGNASVPQVLRFNDCRRSIRSVLHAVDPTPVTIVGSSNIFVDLDGVHEDGSTGPQLVVADTSSFDAAIAYPEQAAFGLIHIGGAAASANNGLRRIKGVWKDGSNSYIDIHQAFVLGAAGAIYEPMTDTTGTPESLTVTFGLKWRNREPLDANLVYFSGKWQFLDSATTAGFYPYQALTGLRGKMMKLGWTGKGHVEAAIDFVGANLLARSNTLPGGGSFTDDREAGPMIVAAKQLLSSSIAIGGASPALHQTSGLGLTGYELTIDAMTETADDVSGTDGVAGMDSSGHKGSYKLSLYDESKVAPLIQQYGFAETHQQPLHDNVFKVTGQEKYISWCVPRSELRLPVTSPSGKGRAKWDLVGTLVQANTTDRMFLYEELEVV